MPERPLWFDEEKGCWVPRPEESTSPAPFLVWWFVIFPALLFVAMIVSSWLDH